MKRRAPVPIPHLQELLFEKPLTREDIRTAHEMLITATPAIARVLLLVIILGSARLSEKHSK